MFKYLLYLLSAFSLITTTLADIGSDCEKVTKILYREENKYGFCHYEFDLGKLVI